MSDHDTLDDNQSRPARSRISIPTVLFAVLVLGGGVLFQNEIWSGNADNLNTYYERHAAENWQSRQQTNRHEINLLSSGATKETVIEKLGPPDFRDAYGDDSLVEVLYYRTRRVADDGMTNKWQETSPLVFVSNRLVASGGYTVDGGARVRVLNTEWYERQQYNNGYIGGLLIDAGVSLEQVLNDLGEPEFSERIGDHVDVLFYRTHSDLDDNHTEKRTETRPLVFAGQTLIARGFSSPVVSETVTD
ncbi:MAG: DUF3192 domain-containing protein [Pseudomonadota bacterium]